MYWLGIIIVSIVWAAGSSDANAWVRYGGAFGIGLLYFYLFQDFA